MAVKSKEGKTVRTVAGGAAYTNSTATSWTAAG
jgi:hypothetical protein